MAFNPRRQPPSPKKKKRAGGGERARREGGLRSALREMFLQPPGAKGWQVSGLGERRAGGRAGAPCARSGGGGWWSKVAGTAKGGVTGGSGRECVRRGQGRARHLGGKGVAANQPPGGVGTTGPHARRQRPASRRGAEAGAERVVRKQGIISREAAQPSRRPTRHRAPRRRGGRTPPETTRRGTRNRGRPPETPPG